MSSEFGRNMEIAFCENGKFIIEIEPNNIIWNNERTNKYAFLKETMIKNLKNKLNENKSKYPDNCPDNKWRTIIVQFEGHFFQNFGHFFQHFGCFLNFGHFF